MVVIMVINEMKIFTQVVLSATRQVSIEIKMCLVRQAVEPGLAH